MVQFIVSDRLSLCLLSHLGFVASSSRSVCEGPWWGFPSRLDMSVNRRLCLFSFIVSLSNHIHGQNLKYKNPRKIFPGFIETAFTGVMSASKKFNTSTIPGMRGSQSRLGEMGRFCNKFGSLF